MLARGFFFVFLGEVFDKPHDASKRKMEQKSVLPLAPDPTDHMFLLDQADETEGNLIVHQLQQHPDIGPLVGISMTRRDQAFIELRMSLQPTTTKTAETVVCESLRALVMELTSLEEAMHIALEQFSMRQPLKKARHNLE